MVRILKRNYVKKIQKISLRIEKNWSEYEICRLEFDLNLFLSQVDCYFKYFYFSLWQFSPNSVTKKFEKSFCLKILVGTFCAT